MGSVDIPQRDQFSNSWTWKYVALHEKRDFADKIKVLKLKIRTLSGIFRWGKLIMWAQKSRDSLWLQSELCGRRSKRFQMLTGTWPVVAGRAWWKAATRSRQPLGPLLTISKEMGGNSPQPQGIDIVQQTKSVWRQMSEALSIIYPGIKFLFITNCKTKKNYLPSDIAVQ